MQDRAKQDLELQRSFVSPPFSMHHDGAVHVLTLLDAKVDLWLYRG
jgi:hypothetical protein